jgi:hypothetical protein
MLLLRVARAAVDEFGKLIPRLWRIARELFHEIIGFLFLALSLFFIVGRGGLIPTYRSLDENPDKLPQLLLLLLFVVLFGVFGISSFLRARRISRERQEEP